MNVGRCSECGYYLGAYVRGCIAAMVDPIATLHAEICKLTADLAEARASLALAQTLIKNGDAQLTRATTAIALEDAVLVVLAEGWVPVFIRRDQVLTSQRIDGAIAASRAERARKETP